MDDDKDYQKSEFAKRVEELMDDGFEFGEAVKEAMKEGYKSGGPVGIEILFTEKVPAAPSQLVSESDILLGYRGDDAARSDRASGRKSGRADPRGGVDRSAVSEGSQYARNVAAQNNEPSFKEKVKEFVTNPAVQTLGGAVLTGGINTAFPGVLDKINKARLISNAIKYGKDIAIEDELENITTQGGIVPYADGGRVGLFMGGPALTGQPLAIYNSMNAYGFSDQEIADAIKEAGYELPTADSGTPPQASQPIGARDDDQDRTFVDRQDYSFNKKNYEPGKQLEINPAAFGISFEKASSPQGIINQALEMPGRTLTSFASPTTGGNITGPAEEGFMSQVVDIDPAGRTREELRQQYDSYNRFFGAPSNFAAARTPGKAGQVLGSVVGAASGIPLLGPGIEALSKMGGGDRGLQSKYTVDNVGFGNTGARDEFGLATFDRKDGFLGLTGNTTKDYTDRMQERLGELSKFFGDRGIDINDPDAYDDMKDINGFYAKQVLAYQQRLAVENINKNTQDAIKAQEEAKKKEEAAFQAQLNETQRQQRMSDLQRIERAYREEVGGRAGSYATGESGIQRDSAGREVGYNDPFDPGGGEKDGGFIDGYNRRKYSDGGLATMFTRRR